MNALPLRRGLIQGVPQTNLMDMSFSFADVILSAAALLLAISTVFSARSGHLPVYPAHMQVSRTGSPVLFWILIALQSAAALALAWIVVS